MSKREIDVEEASCYTECRDCSRGLYVYDNGDYPSNTGPICFDCLRKRYEALRDAAKPLVWSREPPKQVGRYYVRPHPFNRAKDLDVVCIEADQTDGEYQEMLSHYYRAREWAGPIPEPVDPS